MEIALQVRGPAGGFRIRPVANLSRESPTCCKQVTQIRALPRMAASSDYPRRRSKRSLIPKTQRSSPSGFSPRQQIGTSTQKKDQTAQGDEDVMSVSSEPAIPEMKSAEVVSSAPKADASQKEIEELQEEDDDPNSVVGHRMEDFDAEEEQVVNVSLEEVDEVVEEEVSVDPEIQRQILNEIAKETVSCGSKIFYFPQVMKSGHPSKIFLNRENSALVNEPDILIKGAFNKWKWKSFTEKLHKTDLHGDWWSCEIHVPREAYGMDFVFFNGGNIYENNGLKDFHIDIDGEMNPSLFEDFLLKEKQKELQRLAEEQAERERQAEEQRRKE